jgi:hypothetical protein
MSSQITIKRNLIIFHSPNEWDKIYQEIFVAYGIRMSLSYVLKRELGFTVRRHRYFDDDTGRYQEDVRLDFVNETAATFFRMKYL